MSSSSSNKKNAKAVSESAPEEPMGILREYYETILVCVIFVLYTWTFVAMQSKIPSASMQDTLLVGDRIVVNKFAFGMEKLPFLKALLPYKDIHRGDVIVFKSPEDPTKDFIKRVIAVGGDRLEIMDKKVYVNGLPVDEPYAVHGDRKIFGRGASTLFGRDRDNLGPIQVPEGRYFVMGDNRDNSNDSRFWGFVPREYVKGQAVIILWSAEQPCDWNTPILNKLGCWLKSVVHFFSWTRWGRILHFIF